MGLRANQRFLRIVSVITAATLVLGGIVWFLLNIHIGGESGVWAVEFYYPGLLGIVAIVAGVLIFRQLNVEPQVNNGPFRTVRVNVLCLMGAILGVFCIFEWGWASGGYGIGMIQVDWHYWPPIEGFATGEVFCYLFVLGTILAFVTPAAGFLQLSGVTIFAFRLHDILNGAAGSGEWGITGYVAAIVTTSIVVASLPFPYGIGYKNKSVDILGRLLTISSLTWAERIAAWRRHGADSTRKSGL